MLRVLTIEERDYRKAAGFGRVGRLLPSYHRVREYSRGGVIVRHMRYVKGAGGIRWKKIERFGGFGRDTLICSTPIPDGVRVRRFEPEELRRRLCTNMALRVLQRMEAVPKKLRIGVYDPHTEQVPLCEHLLKLSDNVLVVSGDTDTYRLEAERLMSEYGAVLQISRYISSLSRCGLIIAPARLEGGFIPMTKAVVLTSHAAAVSLGCRVYCEYLFDLPKPLRELCPEGIPAELFAGALYTLCSVHSLGSAVPHTCRGYSGEAGADTLADYLCECFGT